MSDIDPNEVGDNWSLEWDAEKSCQFYFNCVTEKTQSERPSCFPASDSDSDDDSDYEDDQTPARVKAEQEAAEQEAARVKAEQEAAEQEAARVKAEQEAAEQEAARVKAEQEAAEQEAARVKAEQEAAEQEASRVKGEQEAAEQKQQQESCAPKTTGGGDHTSNPLVVAHDNNYSYNTESSDVPIVDMDSNHGGGVMDSYHDDGEVLEKPSGCSGCVIA